MRSFKSPVITSANLIKDRHTERRVNECSLPGDFQRKTDLYSNNVSKATPRQFRLKI